MSNYPFDNSPFHQLPISSICCFCQLAFSSICCFVNLQLNHYAHLSICHFISLPFCQFAFLSTWHFIHLPFYSFVSLSFHLHPPCFIKLYFIYWPSYHLVSLQPFPISTWLFDIFLPLPCIFIQLLFYKLATLPSLHFET